MLSACKQRTGAEPIPEGWTTEEILAAPVDVATVDLLKEGIRAKVLLEAQSLTLYG